MAGGKPHKPGKARHGSWISQRTRRPPPTKTVIRKNNRPPPTINPDKPVGHPARLRHASVTCTDCRARAAAILLAAIIGWNLLPRLQRPGTDQLLATQLIGGHVRSLMANHLTDVASSDQHTVKPWLDAKLDFAPPVVDLASEGFPLIGGRLDYLDNRPVAALVYQRRKHFINLFVWPGAAAAARPAMAISHQGYQLLHWADPDFNYWAVSDVNANDLQTFKQQFEAQTPHH